MRGIDVPEGAALEDLAAALMPVLPQAQGVTIGKREHQLGHTHLKLSGSCSLHTFSYKPSAIHQPQSLY